MQWAKMTQENIKQSIIILEKTRDGVRRSLFCASKPHAHFFSTDGSSVGVGGVQEEDSSDEVLVFESGF